MGQQMIDESQVDLSNIKNTLQNKADLVNGKVPAEQLPPASQGGADITLSNVKSIDPSSAVAVELGKKADKTYVDGKLAAKADLVDGKVPADQLPENAAFSADNTLSNVNTIDPKSKVQIELNRKLNTAGGTITGNLNVSKNSIPGNFSIVNVPNGGYGDFAVRDAQGFRIGSIRVSKSEDGSTHSLSLGVHKPADGEDTGATSVINCSIKKDGTVKVEGITPPEVASDARVATTAWVRKYGVNKAGDTMAGRLSMGSNDILFQNPDGGSLLQIATDGSNWDVRGNKTWLRFGPIFGLTIRDAEGTGDFYNLLHPQNFAPDYANKINFSANGTDNTAVKTGYVMIQLNASAAGTSRICTLCIKRNGSEVFSADIGNTTNLEGRYFMSFPIAKGDVYAVSCYNETAATCYFIPLLGA